MRLFTIGPVQMYPSTCSVRGKGFVHFRSAEYSALVKNTLSRLSCLIGNKLEDSIIYLAASGTAAMEATVENCVEDTDKVLVINGGSFGYRFCELLQYHRKNWLSLDLKWNERLSEAHLKKYETSACTMLFVNLHETQTGQLYELGLISDFCKRNQLLLVVDAIGSFLADDYNMDDYGIDLTIISSQKGLCLSPGMSFVSMSQRMIDKVAKNHFPSTRYFDFRDYLLNIKRGQTPFTPPVCVMYELEDMLNLIDEEGGKLVRIKTVRDRALYFRERIMSLGLKLPSYPLSNMLTPIIFDDIDAYEIIQLLKDKYGLFVNPCGGVLSSKLLRVSHIGDNDMRDFDDLVEKLVLSIAEIKGNYHDR